ncbi:hypothetical protein B4U37_08930 [Sutcliffiella horikoshii]|uniref:Uncharacterized protein n=1 Tax=Sutcliffiella horikoshii TaxID=79883 RepID=A0ABM6KIL3_9BACI|nr:hypothetical protein B4U37_08930 [Sutcliffiella horikoshii]
MDTAPRKKKFTTSHVLFVILDYNKREVMFEHYYKFVFLTFILPDIERFCTKKRMALQNKVNDIGRKE